MYRTGDRARWLADGTIEYLGRLDFQIKLRGFRIEVGEIEQALASDPRVRECAVVLRNDAGIEARLVAYFVAVGDAKVSSTELRARLEESLPSYMVPWSYVQLCVMPLSPSGKLDRKALPAPEASSGPRVRIAPRDDVEERVLAIWKQVIGARDIGVTDRFNEVGGNSLAAVRVFSRIAAEFSTKLAARDDPQARHRGALGGVVARARTGRGVEVHHPVHDVEPRVRRSSVRMRRRATS